MLKTEFYTTRTDGVNLYRTYSDLNRYILQVDTGAKYTEAIDIENTSHTYEETEEAIEDVLNNDEERQSR